MSEIITDEIVEKAVDIFFDLRGTDKSSMRAALTAVLPDLIRAEREACAMTVLYKAASHADYQRSQITAEDYAACIRSRKDTPSELVAAPDNVSKA